MKYTGRLLITAFWATMGLFWTFYHGYRVDNNYSEYIFFTLLSLPFFWYLGKQYDKVKSFSNQLEQKQTEIEGTNLELQTYKDRLNGILESIDIVVWSLDENHRINYCSQGAEKLWGLSSTVFMENEQLWKEMIHPVDMSWVVATLSGAALGKSVSAEYRIIKTNGEVRWIQSRLSPVMELGKLIRFDGISVDVSERVKAHEKVTDSETNYRVLQSRLEKFSSNSSRVMDIADLEKIIAFEVEQTFQGRTIALIETDSSCRFRVVNGDYDVEANLEEVLKLDQLKQLRPGELYRFGDKTLVKISHVNHKTYWLYLGDVSADVQETPEYLWLITLSRYVSILFENLLIIDGLSDEIEHHVRDGHAQPWLLKLVFKLSENERKRLSADLHDRALQEQIVWYRKLLLLCTDASIPPHIQHSLTEITEGLMDVIYHIRITCTDLRPPMLQEFGVLSALEELFEQTQLRSDYSVYFDSTGLKSVLLNDEQNIILYRIVQEFLRNANKHSHASRVDITLSNSNDDIFLQYADNGVGVDLDSLTSDHLGIAGIKQRVKSLHGEVEMRSQQGHGLKYDIRIPLYQKNVS